MKHKKKPGVLFYITILLFLLYFVLSSLPCLNTVENRVYFKILFIIPFILLIINSLKRSQYEDND